MYYLLWRQTLEKGWIVDEIKIDSNSDLNKQLSDALQPKVKSFGFHNVKLVKPINFDIEQTIKLEEN